MVSFILFDIKIKLHVKIVGMEIQHMMQADIYIGIIVDYLIGIVK